MAEAPDIYTSAPMQDLLARELAALAPMLSGAYGNCGLVLRPWSGSLVLPPHRIGKIIELNGDEGGLLGGAVRCAPWQLPFASESFNLLIAQHALERIAQADDCLAECARVLAPEGIMLVLGFNPLGTWRPWLARHSRGLRLCSAQACKARLAGEGIETLQVHFPGTLWPRARPGDVSTRPTRSPFARLGSSWLLVARKRRSTLTPIRLRGAMREPARTAQLAPGAHRNCA